MLGWSETSFCHTLVVLISAFCLSPYSLARLPVDLHVLIDTLRRGSRVRSPSRAFHNQKHVCARRRARSLDFILHWFLPKSGSVFFPSLSLSERLWCCWMRPSFSFCFIITPPFAITSSFRSCLARRLFALRLQNVPNRPRQLNFIAIFVLFHLFLSLPGIKSPAASLSLSCLIPF